jgi:hypothetical protein
MGISFTDREQAKEYADQHGAQVKQEGKYYIVDIREHDQRNMDKRMAARLSELEDKEEAMRDVAEGRKSFGKRALGSIFNSERAKSYLNRTLHPNTQSRTVKIGQLPGRKAPIAMDLNKANPISGRNAGMHRHNISYAPRRED